ncbi:hypothetical protein BJ912DRAFT_969089 [Pholiota molesta]|nr:hypothetical protein BJ912DRAFT_969089 [Pholiota molesta]
MFSQWILLSLFFDMLSASVAQVVKNSLYIIRNAEASTGHNNLSDVGIARASQCLPELFGPTSLYNIGLVLTCTPDPSSSTCQTSYATAQPIAVALDLIVDTSCTAGDTSSQHCIKNTISNFAATSDRAVLLVWDENHLSDLRTEFGLRSLSQDQVDVIYTLRNYIYVSETPQNCGPVNSANGDPVSSASEAATVNTPPALSAPLTMTVPGPSPTSQSRSMLDLYYTTTFVIPDPLSTPAVSDIAPDSFIGSMKKRHLHSKKRCRTRFMRNRHLHSRMRNIGSGSHGAFH